MILPSLLHYYHTFYDSLFHTLMAFIYLFEYKSYNKFTLDSVFSVLAVSVIMRITKEKIITVVWISIVYIENNLI